MQSLIASDVAFTVSSRDHYEQARAASRAVGMVASLHLKVDTGMGRLGLRDLDEILSLAGDMTRDPDTHFQGVFTHFACADDPPSPVNGEQEDRWASIVGALESANLRPPLVHASNSACSLSRPAVHADLIRPGIAIYGLDPAPSLPLPDAEFTPALSWYTQLTHVKRVPCNTGLSYSHRYHTTSDGALIGTIPLGYGDGYRRTDGNTVLVHDTECPVVGRVCMDQCLVLLDPLPVHLKDDPRSLVGCPVTVLGGALSCSVLADRWDTITYEVTCTITPRVPRIYV